MNLSEEATAVVTLHVDMNSFLRLLFDTEIIKINIKKQHKNTPNKYGVWFVDSIIEPQ